MDWEHRIAAMVRLDDVFPNRPRWCGSRHLGDPVDPELLATFEGQLGFPLPQDWCDFLRLCNGWQGFSDAYYLFSLEEAMVARESLRLWQNGAMGYAKRLRAAGLEEPSAHPLGWVQACFRNFGILRRQPGYFQSEDRWGRARQEVKLPWDRVIPFGAGAGKVMLLVVPAVPSAAPGVVLMMDGNHEASFASFKVFWDAELEKFAGIVQSGRELQTQALEDLFRISPDGPITQ